MRDRVDQGFPGRDTMPAQDDLAKLINLLAPGVAMPETREGRWRLFRALVNLRAPGPVSAAFLELQDRLLKSEIAAKGITREPGTGPRPRTGCISGRGTSPPSRWTGSSTRPTAPCWGCFHPGHDCIDNVIHTYAGVQLRQACAEIMEKQGHPEPVGKAKLTPGFNLPARYVLHTVGPMIMGPLTEEDRELLASCYRSCLGLAESSGQASLAFCCISTGVYRFPPGEAARIAVAESEAAPRGRQPPGGHRVQCLPRRGSGALPRPAGVKAGRRIPFTLAARASSKHAAGQESRSSTNPSGEPMAKAGKNYRTVPTGDIQKLGTRHIPR